MQPSRLISLLVACTALVFTLLTAVVSSNFDFHAFYCAGYAVNAHANPYHAEPLHACERIVAAGAFGGFFDKVILPAPQPGYDVALFAWISRLHYADAARVWIMLLLVATLGAVIILARLTRAPLAPVFIALWLSLCVPSIYLGEIVPLCVLAIAAAALFAKTSRFALTGLAAAATLVEPHIGVPVCLSAAIWLPRSRVALVVGASALAATSLSVLGVRANIEYLTAVLPAHAVSELGSDAQLSFSALLHAAGFSAAAAIRWGTIAFVVSTTVGIALARVATTRFQDAAFVIAAPAAFSVIGGVFMHATEVAAAIPLMLLLVHYARVPRGLIASALVLLAVPWWSLATPMVLGSTVGIVLAGIAVFYLMLWCTQGSLGVAAPAALGTAAAVTALLHWHDLAAVHQAIEYSPAWVLHATYPEASWKWFNERYMSTGSAASWLLRAGSWSGLALMLLALGAALKSWRPSADTESVDMLQRQAARA